MKYPLFLSTVPVAGPIAWFSFLEAKWEKVVTVVILSFICGDVRPEQELCPAFAVALDCRIGRRSTSLSRL
jgi:hypothetical protein